MSIFLSDTKINNIVIQDNSRECHVTNCELVAFPILPLLGILETLNLSSNNLLTISCTLPDTLRTFILRDNLISHFDVVLNRGLVELDLSQNQLTDIPVSLYDFVPPRINLRDNRLWFLSCLGDLTYMNQMIPGKKVQFLQILGELGIDRKMINFLNDHNYVIQNNLFVENHTLPPILGKDGMIRKLLILPETTTDISQSVHLSSIQKTVSSSIKYIIAYKRHIPFNSQYLANLKCQYTTSGGFSSLLISPILNSNFFEILNRYDKEQYIHSIHKVKLRDILERVYLIISDFDHEQQENLLNILREEITSGDKFCFTGKISRLVNVLCGYIPEVQVGISKQEQLNDNIIQLRKKYSDDELIQKTKDLLLEFEVPLEDQASYLDYL